MSEPSRPDDIAGLFARYGPAYRWLVTVTVMLATFSTVLTATSVNVALPDIMGAFGMGLDKVQLLSTGFLAAMTGTMLLNAWMVESFGQRHTYIGAVAVFIVGSVMGGLAPTEPILVLGRVLQGAAAGLLQPLAMQVIFQVFPANRRGQAMGVYGVGVVLAPALGPTLGGMVVDVASWRYVFFMAVPVCVLGVFMALLFMPGRARSGPARRFDWIGFALLSLFLLMLLDGLSHGQRDGWRSHSILGSLAIAAVTGTAFVAWELVTPAPMLNLKLYANRTFAAASAVALIFGAGIYGSTYLMPLFVQTIQGYTATRAGLLLMPAGLVLTVFFPIAGRLTDRFSAWQMIVAGSVIFALSSLLQGDIDVDTGFWTAAWWMVLGRIGLAMIMPALNAGALQALPPTLIAQGSGAVNFMRQLGGALGVNGLSVMLERRSQFHVEALVATQDAANGTTGELLRRLDGLYAQFGVPPDLREAGALDYLGQIIVAQASAMGYRECFLACALLFALVVLPALMMRQPRPRTGPPASVPRAVAGSGRSTR